MKVKALLFLGVLASMTFVANAQGTRADDKFVIHDAENLVLKAGETVEVQMDFYNKTGYAAVQGDLHMNNPALSYPKYEEYDEDLEETITYWGKPIGRAARHSLGMNTPPADDDYPCDLRWVFSNLQNILIRACHPDTYTGTSTNPYGVFTFLIKVDENAQSGEFEGKIDHTVYSTGNPDDQTNGVDGVGAKSTFTYKVEAKPITGVNDVNAAKNISSVKYYNIAGVESNVPFEGVNVVVTTYDDGTKAATKVIK